MYGASIQEINLHTDSWIVFNEIATGGHFFSLKRNKEPDQSTVTCYNIVGEVFGTPWKERAAATLRRGSCYHQEQDPV